MVKPFFSIIVPIYNVKEYLTQCVDSVIVQDYTNYELILVDDGSTDGSSVVCDEYEDVDSRIKVIHKANGGLSDARNRGMDLASGNFLFFLDSDDWLLEKRALSIIADIIECEHADVVFYSYKKFYEHTGKYSKSMYNHVPDIADIRECIKANAYKALAGNKVIRHSLITENSMHFPVGQTGEDLIWCADLLACAKKISICKTDIFAYRQRKCSITGNKDKKFRAQHITNELYLINEAVIKYEISPEGSKNNELIGHYLGYEFSWLLGEVYPFWHDFSDEIKKLDFLLKFNMSDKTAKVSMLKSLIGLRPTSFMLNLYIRMKKV